MSPGKVHNASIHHRCNIDVFGGVFDLIGVFLEIFDVFDVSN